MAHDCSADMAVFRSMLDDYISRIPGGFSNPCFLAARRRFRLSSLEQLQATWAESWHGDALLAVGSAVHRYEAEQPEPLLGTAAGSYATVVAKVFYGMADDRAALLFSGLPEATVANDDIDKYIMAL